MQAGLLVGAVGEVVIEEALGAVDDGFEGVAAVGLDEAVGVVRRGDDGMSRGGPGIISTDSAPVNLPRVASFRCESAVRKAAE